MAHSSIILDDHEAAAPTSLLCLPTELRLMIFKQVFHSYRLGIYRVETTDTPTEHRIFRVIPGEYFRCQYAPPHPLAYVCKKICAEIEDMVYTESEFSLERLALAKYARVLSRTIPSTLTSRIRRLNITLEELHLLVGRYPWLSKMRQPTHEKQLSVEGLPNLKQLTITLVRDSAWDVICFLGSRDYMKLCRFWFFNKSFELLTEITVFNDILRKPLLAAALTGRRLSFVYPPGMQKQPDWEETIYMITCLGLDLCWHGLYLLWDAMGYETVFTSESVESLKALTMKDQEAALELIAEERKDHVRKDWKMFLDNIDGL